MKKLNKEINYISYDEHSNLICSYKYKHAYILFLINFSTETATVLDIETDILITRNFSYRFKDKLINKLSKNDIKLDIDSYLNKIENIKK